MWRRGEGAEQSGGMGLIWKGDSVERIDNRRKENNDMAGHVWICWNLIILTANITQ
jgi:hypothetical protein